MHTTQGSMPEWKVHMFIKSMEYIIFFVLQEARKDGRSACVPKISTVLTNTRWSFRMTAPIPPTDYIKEEWYN